MRGRDNLWFCVDELEDALAGGHGGLQNIVFLAEVLNRPEKALRVLDERYQHADRDRAPYHAASADPYHHGNCGRAENFDHWIIKSVGEDRILEGDQMRAVDRFEVLVSALLPVEELHQAHPCDVFLRVAVYARDGRPNA